MAALIESSRIVMLFSSDRCRDASAAFLPTLEKYWLNSFATTDRFLVLTAAEETKV